MSCSSDDYTSLLQSASVWLGGADVAQPSTDSWAELDSGSFWFEIKQDLPELVRLVFHNILLKI